MLVLFKKKQWNGINFQLISIRKQAFRCYLTSTFSELFSDRYYELLAQIELLSFFTTIVLEFLSSLLPQSHMLACWEILYVTMKEVTINFVPCSCKSAWRRHSSSCRMFIVKWDKNFFWLSTSIVNLIHESLPSIYLGFSDIFNELPWKFSPIALPASSLTYRKWECENKVIFFWIIKGGFLKFGLIWKISKHLNSKPFSASLRVFAPVIKVAEFIAKLLPSS